MLNKVAFLADGIIPNAKPTVIPGMPHTVSLVFGYGLWLVVLADVGGVGMGVYKLAVSDKGRHGGGGAEPFKWMGRGVAAILLASALITILNGIAGG